MQDIYVHRSYILYKYYTLHKGFYKQKVTTHSYLMVCIWTLKDARCKMKIWATSMSQKRPVQAELVLSLRKVTLRAQWKINTVVKNQNEFHVELVNESNAFFLFLYFCHNQIEGMRKNRVQTNIFQVNMQYTEAWQYTEVVVWRCFTE